MADKERRKNLAYGLGVVLVVVSLAMVTGMATSNYGEDIDPRVVLVMGIAGGFFFAHGRRR